jgi:hypothetical protein
MAKDPADRFPCGAELAHAAACALGIAVARDRPNLSSAVADQATHAASESAPTESAPTVTSE